jgi:hypothetical protein
MKALDTTHFFSYKCLEDHIGECEVKLILISRILWDLELHLVT